MPVTLAPVDRGTSGARSTRCSADIGPARGRRAYLSVLDASSLLRVAIGGGAA